MPNNLLVRVNNYSNKIRELPMIKRITIDYPLLCREEVASKLADAANKLPDGLILQIDSAYRTKKTQQTLWNMRNKVIPGLVHNPDDGQSPHCTGGAIDVDLLDVNGKEINLSEPFLKYYKEPQLYSGKISKRAQELRIVLNETMLDAGFAPHPKEYWHFSYGDMNWSDYTSENELYKEFDLESEQYFPLYRRIFNKLLVRSWKMIVKIFNIQTNY